jgi:Ca-activated chloride channel homolog
MEHRECARLESRDGRSAMLEGLRATGDLQGLLLEMSVEQRFRNTAKTNMEVVYRFPLPWGAVLLGVDVVLGGQRLTGTVVEKRQAEARYEDALSQGQSAIMLERIHDGSYGLNLGNLLAGETCQVTLRYAQVLQFEQGSLRLSIPTVIAPRYGDPVRDGGLQPHQTADFDLLAAYPFEIWLRLHGELARARVASPSHPIAVGMEEMAGEPVLGVSLARQGALDRDFVLTIDRLVHPSLAVVAPDSVADQVVVLASFCPRFPRQTKVPALKILVDCSGSMGGDSIAAARRALQAVLRQLEPEDRFSLSRFGSTVEHRSRGLWSVTEATRLGAQRWVGALEADLGGTEMEAALVSTCAMAHGGDSDLLLITDGEIEGIDRTIATVRDSGHRVFVVGIGASPAASHLRRLAEATDGACDFVAPGEAVEPAVLRMFARLRSPRQTDLTLVWPDGLTPLWATPLALAIFDGDTVHCFAGFGQVPTGAVRLLGIQAGESEAAEIACAAIAASADPRGEPSPEAGDALARMAAAARVQSLAAAEAVELAVAYGLATDRTNFLLVQARADGEMPTDMPELHTVAQMLPAGWGGTGSVLGEDAETVFRCSTASASAAGAFGDIRDASSDDDVPALARRPVLHRKPAAPGDIRGPSVARVARDPQGTQEDEDLDYLDIPAFLRRQCDDSPPPASPRAPADEALGLTPLALSDWLRRTPQNRWPRTYAGLQALGLGLGVLDWLELVVAVGAAGRWEEEVVVATFLHCLARDALNAALHKPPGIRGSLAAVARRLRRPAAGGPEPLVDPVVDPELVERILSELQGIEAERWPDGVYALAAHEGGI